MLLAVLAATAAPSPSPTPGDTGTPGTFGIGSIVFFVFAMAIITGLILIGARRNREISRKPPSRPKGGKTGGSDGDKTGGADSDGPVSG